MSENFNSHIACEGTDNDINWVCKVCKDLPNYAGMYLYQREREKNQLKNVKDKDILKKSGEYEPVRWKSYIDKVDAYQGEIVSKSEVLKQFKLKVKRSQDQLVLDEWEECDLLLREIFAAFEK